MFLKKKYKHVKVYITFVFFFSVYFWESKQVSGGVVGESRGKRIRSPLYTDSSEPNGGLELRSHEIMTSPEVGHSTQAPMHSMFYLFLREKQRQNMSGGGADRKGGIESKAASRLWAVSTEHDAGLKLVNPEIMTWAEVGHLTDWATEAPQIYIHF